MCELCGYEIADGEVLCDICYEESEECRALVEEDES